MSNITNERAKYIALWIVEWNKSNVPFDFVGMCQLCAQAEIANLDHHVLEKNVIQLEITMNDELPMHVLDAVQDLTQIVACFDLCQTFSPPNETSECLGTKREELGQKMEREG